MIFDSPLSVLRLFLWRRSTGLEHLLQHLEPHPCLGLVLTDCQVICQVCVAHQTGKCVPGKVAQKLVFPSPKFLTCADELPTQTWWCQHGLCPCTWTADAPSGRGCWTDRRCQLQMQPSWRLDIALEHSINYVCLYTMGNNNLFY